MLVNLTKFAAIFASVLVLTACGDPDSESSGGLRGLFGGLGNNAKQEPLESRSAEAIYEEAQQLLTAGDNEEAAELFAAVERLYPYSALAQKGLIQSAFAHYQGGDYEQSRADAQRYLDVYPADEDAAFASYLIGLSWYDQIDDVSRDQAVTFEALQGLLTTIERYPDSEYALSAKLKFDLALDHLAGKEMDVGRYYLRRGHFGAAISRFRVVVEDFETTSHTPEALFRLVESYLSLGLTADAQTAGAILGYNFQASDWYLDAYVLLTEQGLSTQDANPNASGWLSQIWGRVIKGNWL